jgi:hypothetical protein
MEEKVKNTTRKMSRVNTPQYNTVSGVLGE